MDINLVKTPDVNLATTLLCLGFSIEGIDDINPQKVFFYFRENDQLNLTINRYWKGDLLVDPKMMGSCRREVMTRLHDNQKREPELSLDNFPG